jgi:putative proteasome-type protease
MTYGLGMLLDNGLVMASDSRSNAGIDQIAQVKKMTVFARDGERVMVLLAAGNLATTQSVSELLEQALGTGRVDDLFQAQTLFDATQIVGTTLRNVVAGDAQFVSAHGGDPNASFLFGGQIVGSEHRLFLIYPAGNFIEASDRNAFLQIGETKYGKPILDRALKQQVGMEEAARLALLSFDATMRSNLSVAPPIDMLLYRAGSMDPSGTYVFDRGDDYFKALSEAYSDGLAELLQDLPPFPL